MRTYQSTNKTVDIKSLDKCTKKRTNGHAWQLIKYPRREFGNTVLMRCVNGIAGISHVQNMVIHT